MSRPTLAPVAAATAVAGGLALIGASLGGIATTDRQLAASSPGVGATTAARSSTRDAGATPSLGTSAVDASFREGARERRLRHARAYRDGGRIVGIVATGGGTVVVLLAPARPHPRVERAVTSGPAV